MPFLHKVSQNIIKCIYGHQIGPGNIVPHLLLECNVWVEWNQTLGWGGKGFQLHDGHYSSFILFFVIDNNGILCQNLDWTRYWTTEQIYLSWVCHNYVSLHWYMIFSLTLQKWHIVKDFFHLDLKSVILQCIRWRAHCSRFSGTVTIDSWWQSSGSVRIFLLKSQKCGHCYKACLKATNRRVA